MSVRIETNVGSFEVDLFVKDAPKACFNFLKLCKINYYAYSIFLRCEANFLLQGGDPSNTGKGGESIWQLLKPSDQALRFFGDEIDVTKKKHQIRGTLSMASAGKDKNASQFFITLADDLDFLDGTCTIFGLLTCFTPRGDGGNLKTGSVETEAFFDYFNNDLYCDEGGRPFQDVFIISTEVLNDPFPDPEGFDVLVKRSSEDPSEAFLKHKRIGAHESLDDFKAKSEQEIEEELRERAAKSNALVLEIIGDLPSADVKPPENVLFVCKLNPITQAEDLKMIFSRFGHISSCEVIKDRETGASLGYAFIEFEEKESCEQAYLKMDNVLIDDRRVKVDFSQSVAKLHKQWTDKRQGKQVDRDSVDRNRESSHKREYDKKYYNSDRHRNRERIEDYDNNRGGRGDYSSYRERREYYDNDYRAPSRHDDRNDRYSDRKDYHSRRSYRSKSPSYRK